MRIEINAERRGEIPVNAGKGGRNPAKNLKPIRRKEVTMINIVKIQNDCIKKLVQGERVLWCECKDGIWVTTDDYACYNIPKSQFYVDLSSKTPSNYIGKLRAMSLSAEPVEATGEMKSLDKFNVVKFVTAKGEEHWLQEKFAKICDRWLFYNSAFYGVNNGGIPVAIIMEMRLK